MRVRIVVTSDEGISYEGDAELVPSSTTTRKPSKQAARAAGAVARPSSIGVAPDFDLPVRAFANRYAKNLSGPRKYAVLVARLCSGKLGEPISPRDVERQWRSMTEPMGGAYNGAHLSRAKNEGWIDQPTRESVVLLKDWVNALEGK
jgi:hypothetical protein